MSGAIRGFYNDSASNLSVGTDGDIRATLARALHVNLRDPSGNYVAPGGGTTDEAAFTAGASTFNPVGGAFNDSAAALTSGQQGTARATANRALHVNLRDHLGNEATLTGNSLNVNVTNGGSGGTSSADLAAFVAGTTLGTPMIGVFNDGLTNLTSGQMGVPRMTNTRSMHVTLDNASVAVTGTFWQATQPVSGTFWQATQPVSAASLPLPAGASTDATVAALQVAQGSTTSGQKGDLVLGAVTTAAPSYTTAQSSPLSLDTSGSLRVSLQNASVAVTGTFFQATQPVSIAAAVTVQQATAANLNVTVGNATLAVTQSGTWTDTVTQATASSLNAQVVGSIANASADSGNPVKVGGVYTSALKTALTTGNRGDIALGSQGEVIMQGLAPVSYFGTQATTLTSTVTETTIVTAGAAGVFNDLVLLVITNQSATALIVTLKDGTAGTTRGIFAIAANGGIVIPWHHRLAQSAAAANWTLTCGTSVASIYVHAHFVTRK